MEGIVSFYLAVIVMGAVEEEGTFWIQLLMLVMLAAGAGIYILFKSRVKRAGRETHDEVIETIIETPVVSLVNAKISRRKCPASPTCPFGTSSNRMACNEQNQTACGERSRTASKGPYRRHGAFSQKLFSKRS